MIQKLNAFLDSIVAVILTLLPNDPFKSFIDNMAISPYLGYINWIIPVGSILTIATAWVTAIGVFYVYQLVLRWAKVVSD